MYNYCNRQELPADGACPSFGLALSQKRDKKDRRAGKLSLCAAESTRDHSLRSLAALWRNKKPGTMMLSGNKDAADWLTRSASKG